VKIDFVVPGVERDRFSAGILAIVKYANGLVDRGHDVRLVAAGRGLQPRWIDLRARLEAPMFAPREALRRIARTSLTYSRWRTHRVPGEEVHARVRELIRLLSPCSVSDAHRRGGELERLRRILGSADMTIATGYSTVLPVYLYGGGCLVHFVQNYEPWFASALEDPVLAQAEARLGHHLPLHRITNVGWIAKLLEEHHGETVPICPGAVEQLEFHPQGAPPERPFTVVSPGGRGLRWKGFPDAVQAVGLARREIPDLRWRVYGGADPGPANPKAPYEDEGFLQPPDLAVLYSTAHVTLCPSWFEAFPYPPLEAMACGSVPVVTNSGAGDLAEHGRNALVVPPGDPEAMAAALVRLWREPELRRRIAEEGMRRARAFTWERSITRFATLIEELEGAPRLARPEVAPPDFEDLVGLAPWS
jgi:glycosyltransferase involved in cell wall biosynthesis